jgi:Cu+-exporting ATPase
MPTNKAKSVLYGTLASAALLGLYFTVLTLVSGRGFAQNQFAQFWPFVLSLAVGFGVQIGLYTYLRKLVQAMRGAGKVVAVTGTTSTVAMISCCAHYLANLLPLIAVSGAVTLIVQYQVEWFWFGLVLNFAGIVYILRQIHNAKHV